MMKRRLLRNESGQVLVALLAFMATAITLTTMAAIVTVTSAQTTTKYGLGQTTLGIAEAGLEAAIPRLLRDPAYAGETMTIAPGVATITVSGGATKTITSVGAYGTMRRTVQATATSVNNVVTVSNWSEVP